MSARAGVVYLVGAGPGDPGLITVRGLELLSSADAIFHDRLIGTELLGLARAGAELVDVGKRVGEGSAAKAQREIETRMIEAARAGRSVVRLKGGDPLVFARGGEEAEALREAGVQFEVVPGVTAGIGAPAYAGIPLTHREAASAVAFITAHEDPEKSGPALDFEALARFPGTLVLYMGVRTLRATLDALIAAGRDPDEPAAIIERGTFPAQRTVSSTLSRMADEAQAARISAPALVVIGQVAARRRQLAWLERRPLHGRRVLVTRARAQASLLAERLRDLGAEVIELPAIRIEPRIESAEARAAIDALHTYALICVTSPNGVHLLFEAMERTGRDARALASATVAAIGPGTASALAEHGIRADIVPERFVAESLLSALEQVDVSGRPVLLARAAGARSVLAEGLSGRGALVDDVAVYETRAEQPDPASLERAGAADYVTFTSASTVRNLSAALGGELPATARIVTIGPITSRAATEAGLTVSAEAPRHDIEGLIDALLEDVSAQSRAA